MAIINSYPTIDPKGTDLLLISDVNSNGNPTKTTTINSVLALVPGGGEGVSSIQSSNSNVLLVTNSTGPVVTLGIQTIPVQLGGNSLSTSGDIYNFVNTFVVDYIANGGYTNNTGTVTSFSANSLLPGLTLSVNTPTTTPSLDLSITGSPSNSQFLRGDGVWAVPGGTGAMSNWKITGDNGTIAVVVDGETVDVQGGTKITTSVNLGQEVRIDHDSTTTTPTTSSSSPGASGTFDAIDTISYDSMGHITGFNTNTVTLPAGGGGGGAGTVTSVGLDVAGVSFLSSTPAFITSSGTFTVTASGTASEYVKGDGTLGSILSIPGTYSWGIQADSGSSLVASGTSILIEGGTNITTSLVGNTLTIDGPSSVGTVTSVGATNTAFINGATSEAIPTNPITGSGTLSYSLSATGTPSSSTFLRGDNTWATTGTLTGTGSTGAFASWDTATTLSEVVGVTWDGSIFDVEGSLTLTSSGTGVYFNVFRSTPYTYIKPFASGETIRIGNSSTPYTANLEVQGRVASTNNDRTEEAILTHDGLFFPDAATTTIGANAINLNPGTKNLAIGASSTKWNSIGATCNTFSIITGILQSPFSVTSGLVEVDAQLKVESLANLNGEARLNDVVKMTSLQSFADDAAAGVGGVAQNSLYQTDGTGAAPLNVAGILMVKQ
jgi:hypothetical protein